MNRRQLMLASGGIAATFGASGSARSADADAVESAKAVIRDHEDKARGGDLDEIVRNMSEEIVLFAPGAELVQGIKAFRKFYQPILDMGVWNFTHDYSGHDIEGEAVFLYGISRGTLSAPDSPPEPFANNFLLVLKPERGIFRLWRGAFAPSA